MTRICPKPKPWDKAYNHLKSFAEAHDCKPPFPPKLLILAGWVFSNDYEKKNRWEETVEWAESNGCLYLVDCIPDSDFYFVNEPSSYAEGTVYRPWDTESKKRPSSGVLEKSMETLVQQWPKIACKKLSNITQPIKFTGKKARRLLVQAEAASHPPWGGWTYLSKVESERRAFTKFRALVNQAILPHEVDHIDFLADEIAERDSTMEKAHCHSQEYWYLRKQKCECGSELQLIDQVLTERDQTFVDVHRTQCKQCGTFREFVFDISSFYKPLRSFDELAEVERLLKRVYPESEVPMRMAYPMEATLWYIKQLEKSNDIMALEYIAEAVQYAMTTLRNHSLAIKKSDLISRGLESFSEIENIQSNDIVSTKPRLLHVDDDSTLLSVTAEYFRNERYEIYTALSSEEALEFLSKKSVDIVITGINQPDINGWELTKIIKNKYGTEVIILTGFHLVGNRDKARKLGASEYITKPCRLTDLLKSVMKVHFMKVIKELVSKGKKQGYLTYAEINELLPEHTILIEQIDQDQDGNEVFKKRPPKKYRPWLRKRGSYQDFEELKDHIENAPDSKITMCMDKALLEGRTYDQLLEEMAINNKRLDSNDFLNISRIDSHIRYREDHDGWKFRYSGERKESNTRVRLVGLRLVKSA